VATIDRNSTRSSPRSNIRTLPAPFAISASKLNDAIEIAEKNNI